MHYDSSRVLPRDPCGGACSVARFLAVHGAFQAAGEDGPSACCGAAPGEPCSCGTSPGTSGSLVASAVAVHHTATSNKSWDAGENEGRLPTGEDATAAKLKPAYAWVDPDKDAATKAAYKFIHHEVGADGKVGAANKTACSAGIGALNGARGGSSIPDGDRKAVWSHLRAHLLDAGVDSADVPELKSSASEAAEAFSHAVTSGTHEHPHPAYGSQGDDATHEHPHAHDGDASHDHEHAGLTASSPPEMSPDDVAALEKEWHAYLFVAGLRTTDGRAAQPGGGVYRAFPLPMKFLPSNEGGHYGSVVTGQIDSIEEQEQDGGWSLFYAQGVWDLDSEWGPECARQVALQGGNRFVSAEIEYLEAEYVSVDGGDDDVDFLDLLFGGPGEVVELATRYRISGGTVCDTPAFPQCVIAPRSVALTVVAPLEEAPAPVKAPLLVASAAPLSAAGFPERPPRAWFARPDVPGPLGPVVVTPEGRFYGYAAEWGTCHTGDPHGPGVCVVPPRSRAGYSRFPSGWVTCDDGEDLRVGHVTMGCGHASLRLGAAAAQAHYDGGPGAVVCADVVAGEDEWGLWVSGVVRRDLTDDQLRQFRSLAPSGDWRRGELVAVLMVPVPGFRVSDRLVASAAGAEGEDGRPRALAEMLPDGTFAVTALVAAGRVYRDPLRAYARRVEERLTALERAFEMAVVPGAVERLAAAMSASGEPPGGG